MSKTISDTEYQLLKKFLDCHFKLFYPKNLPPPPESPSEFLRKIEATSLSNAKRGLQMAINDTIEEITDWSPQRIAEADAQLAAAGVFTLSELRKRYSKKYQAILKRGVIRNDTEFYIIKNIRDDGGVEKEETPEGIQIQKMIEAYENHIMEKLEQNKLKIKKPKQ